MANNVEYGSIILNPGQSQTWWHTWTHIKSWDWTLFSASSSTPNGKIEITRQWSEMDIHGTSKWLVTFRNVGSVQAVCRRHAHSDT
jgi:hypothetical protein